METQKSCLREFMQRKFIFGRISLGKVGIDFGLISSMILMCLFLYIFLLATTILLRKTSQFNGVSVLNIDVVWGREEG